MGQKKIIQFRFTIQYDTKANKFSGRDRWKDDKILLGLTLVLRDRVNGWIDGQELKEKERERDEGKRAAVNASLGLLAGKRPSIAFE